MQLLMVKKTFSSRSKYPQGRYLEKKVGKMTAVHCSRALLPERSFPEFVKKNAEFVSSCLSGKKKAGSGMVPTGGSPGYIKSAYFCGGIRRGRLAGKIHGLELIHQKDPFSRLPGTHPLTKVPEARWGKRQSFFLLLKWKPRYHFAGLKFLETHGNECFYSLILESNGRRAGGYCLRGPAYMVHVRTFSN